jgi:2-polyprenyl-3-methyl-5-hydroxy-6-metoxy-1,4-benzoquinol methylase
VERRDVVTRLSIREVIRTGPPSTDRNGLVFQLDGHVYRAFRGESATLFERLLSADWTADLFAAGLVRFDRSELELDGYDLVVEAERVPVVSYPPEWPNVMLAEAGATIAAVGAALSSHGLGLKDAHPWNVLFRGPTPLFVDLGSVVPRAHVSGAWVDEFRRHIVLPLALRRRGLHQAADAVQHSQRSGWISQFERRALRPFPLRYMRVARLRGHTQRFFADLERYVRALSSEGRSGAWSHYYVEGDAMVGEAKKYNAKQRSMDVLLGQVPPESVLDVGANAGWYSSLAARHGHAVTAIDVDDPALSALYRSAVASDANILPLRIDLMWPTGSSGFALEYVAAPERLRSETVLALAVLHHVLRSGQVTFDAFARVLDMFAIRRTIVEFIPGEDQHLATWGLRRDPTYRKESLIEAMSPYFDLRSTHPSTPEPREILTFERG